jgi:hypothetical protein
MGFQFLFSSLFVLLGLCVAVPLRLAVNTINN